MDVFIVITTVASLLFMFVWVMIVASYLVYRRRHPERHAASAYRMPGIGDVLGHPRLFRIRDLDAVDRT